MYTLSLDVCYDSQIKGFPGSFEIDYATKAEAIRALGAWCRIAKAALPNGRVDSISLDVSSEFVGNPFHCRFSPEKRHRYLGLHAHVIGCDCTCGDCNEMDYSVWMAIYQKEN